MKKFGIFLAALWLLGLLGVAGSASAQTTAGPVMQAATPTEGTTPNPQPTRPVGETRPSPRAAHRDPLLDGPVEDVLDDELTFFLGPDEVRQSVSLG